MVSYVNNTSKHAWRKQKIAELFRRFFALDTALSGYDFLENRRQPSDPDWEQTELRRVVLSFTLPVLDMAFFLVYHSNGCLND